MTFAAIAALILVALLAFFIKERGFRASSAPGAFETSAARLMRDFAIPRADKGRKNPLAGDDHAVGQGRDEFLSRCATCHGSDGRGATPIGSNLYPRVPDLRGPTTRHSSSMGSGCSAPSPTLLNPISERCDAPRPHGH